MNSLFTSILKKMQNAFYPFHLSNYEVLYSLGCSTPYSPEGPKKFYFEINHPKDSVRLKDSVIPSVVDYPLKNDYDEGSVRGQLPEGEGKRMDEQDVLDASRFGIRWRLLHQLKAYRDAVDVNMISSITDTTGKIVYVNSNFCKISGYTDRELLGQNHRIIRSGHHSKEFFAELWLTISSGQLWHGEILNRAKDGNTYWVDTVIIPIFNEENAIEKYLSLRMLISDRKHAEEQFRNYTHALEKIAFMVAHEIRGPLCSILGLVNLLSRTNSSEADFKTALQYLRQSANQLNALTGELSRFVFENEIEMQTRILKEKIDESKRNI